MWVKESFQKSSCMVLSSRIQVSFDVSMWKEKKWEESTKELFPKSSLTGLSSRIQVSFDIYTWKKKNTRWTHRLHCAATPCNTVQCAAIHCFTTQLHRVCGKGKMDIFWNCIYTHAQTLQHTATHCNALQPTSTHVTLCITTDLLLRGQLAGYFRISTFTHTYTLQHTATHFNTLQRTCGEDKVDVSEFWQKGRRTHTATHCNTLQRTCGEGKLDISEFWKRGWHLILWGEGEG